MIMPFDMSDCIFESYYLLPLVQLELVLHGHHTYFLFTASFKFAAQIVIKEIFFQDGISFN